MKERPLLMSPYMVRAILKGDKTETRRMMRYQPDSEFYGPQMYAPVIINRDGEEEPGKEIFGIYGDDWGLKCPYGQPGDQLWIKETWAHDDIDCKDHKCGNRDHIWYRASEIAIVADSFAGAAHWRASMFMPRWASRIDLLITEIRAERLQDITEEGARAEGVHVWAQAELLQHSRKESEWCTRTRQIAQQRREPIPVAASNVAAYAMLWDSLNPKSPWESNPWVWVVKFKKI